MLNAHKEEEDSAQDKEFNEAYKGVNKRSAFHACILVSDLTGPEPGGRTLLTLLLALNQRVIVAIILQAESLNHSFPYFLSPHFCPWNEVSCFVPQEDITGNSSFVASDSL